MSRDTEYRRNAAEAQAWADKARTDQDRAAWLRVVQGWLGLIHKPRQTDQNRFDEQTKARGTGQEGSRGTH